MDTLLHLERRSTLWRMDRETFFRFMSYVSGYFEMCDSITNANATLKYEDILYADISYENLKVVSVIFGRYFPNSDTLLLSPVKPGVMVMLWGFTFKMFICERREDKFIFRSIVMQNA